MLGSVDRQGEELLRQGWRSRALVLYDYLLAFVRDQGFGEQVQDRLHVNSEAILHPPSLSRSGQLFFN